MARSHWKFLKTGDVVDLIAPGFACSPQDVENGKKLLLSWGLVPRVQPGMLSPHFLHAADDDVRFEQLRSALLAKDSTAIWCMRGGYGANRLIPRLAKIKKPKHPKLVIGLSDVTSIHLFLQQSWKWPSLHGALLDRMGSGRVPPRDVKDLRAALFGKSREFSHKGLRPMNEAAADLRALKAEVVGGNAVVLQSTLGTPWAMKTAGKILFLEEIGERGYRLDRIFEHFRQTGVLRGCKAVVMGQFIGGDEPRGGNLVQDVLQRFARETSIPVFSGLEAGHDIRQAILPLGTLANLRRKGQTYELSLSSGGRATWS